MWPMTTSAFGVVLQCSVDSPAVIARNGTCCHWFPVVFLLTEKPLCLVLWFLFVLQSVVDIVYLRSPHSPSILLELWRKDLRNVDIFPTRLSLHRNTRCNSAPLCPSSLPFGWSCCGHLCRVLLSIPNWPINWVFPATPDLLWTWNSNAPGEIWLSNMPSRSNRIDHPIDPYSTRCNWELCVTR